jgi:signal transduction histidine kinase
MKDGLITPGEFGPHQIENTVKGLEVIKEQGGDLMQFVQSYRSFLNLPPPDKKLVPAGKLLDRFRVIMDQQRKGKDIKFRAMADPADLELFIDEKQVSQILINLGKNALQALDGRKNAEILVLAGINAQGQNYICISDNGPGIQPEMLEEIFVPFFTTKKAGTGIGLSLSKQIMHRHGGNLSVHSELDKETTFMLTF